MTNEQILQELKEAMVANTNTNIMKQINEALTHAMSAIHNMDKKLAEEYDRGCNDAWELARKIGGTSDTKGYYNTTDLYNMFGMHSSLSIFNRFEYAQIVEREKRYLYEKSKEEESQNFVRGDEVEIDGPNVYRCIGLFLYEDDDCYWVLRKSHVYQPQRLSKRDWALTKTGKHIELFGEGKD